MDQKQIAFVVIGVITFVIGGSDAITCYDCDSRNVSNCFDPFSTSGVNTCIGAACIKVKGHGQESNVTSVIRGCESFPLSTEGDLCLDVSVSGVKARSCICRSNYCNDAGILKPLYKIIVAVMIAAIMAITWVNKI